MANRNAASASKFCFVRAPAASFIPTSQHDKPRPPSPDGRITTWSQSAHPAFVALALVPGRLLVLGESRLPVLRTPLRSRWLC